MEYQGKLYGKLGGKKYFDTGKTSEDFDTMESLHKSSSHQIRMLMNENLKLQSENIKLRNCGNCKHEHRPFVEGTPCLGCCLEDEFSNWEGK